MARGGNRGRSAVSQNGSDPGLGRFEASRSAATVSPDPPYNREFSIPIPVVETQYHEALKRAIQQQKSQEKIQHLAIAEAEAASIESINESRKDSLRMLKNILEEKEEIAKHSNRLLEDAGARMDIASNSLKTLIDEKQKLEEEQKKALNDKEKQDRLMEEKTKKHLEEKSKMKAKLDSLKKTLKEQEDILAKLMKEEKEYNEKINVDDDVGINESNTSLKEDNVLKRKRQVEAHMRVDTNKENNDEKLNNEKNTKIQNELRRTSMNENLKSKDTTNTKFSQLGAEINKSSNNKYELQKGIEITESNEHTNESIDVNDEQKRQAALSVRNYQVDVVILFLVLKSFFQKFTFKTLQQEVVELNQTKSLFIWLLKQVSPFHQVPLFILRFNT